MDRDSEDTDENARLLNSPNERNRVQRAYGSRSEPMASSSDTIVFDSNMMKTSTHTEELAATWGGIGSLPDSGTPGRLRRVRSWSGGPPDDNASEVRILRERLVRTQAKLRPGAIRRLTRHQRLTLASLALVDFMSFCSMSIMAPFFPREATAKGLSETMCGVVFSFYAVVMFITSPFFGKYLPMIGAKFMFTAGMFMAGSCNVLFGTLVLVEDPTTFTILCFVVRGMEALGASAYSTASYVFVVNAFPDTIGSVLGILETFVGLGMSVGPAIGGLLYSIGGFGLPFYSLGIIMVLTVPINYCLLTDCEEYVSGSKTASILKLFKIPSIIITGLVIVIVSNTWAFLDPTLEPHLRQFGLSTNQIGLIFLLFSSLYGIFSPIWGWVADRVHNHWCMMVWGLFLSTIGLLLLGPCPFIPGLPKDLWLDLVALSILGMSVALTLLPTFQGVLTSSIYDTERKFMGWVVVNIGIVTLLRLLLAEEILVIFWTETFSYEGGCPEALATYSAVAGVWSCCYSLGEVLGPALGGAFSEQYGFPLCATLCAGACFTMAVVTLTFFSLRESSKWVEAESGSNSIPYTDTTWNSNHFCRTRSAPASQLAENSPLITPCSCASKTAYYLYGNSPTNQMFFIHKKNGKNGSASISDVMAYFLKFEYLTDVYVRIRRSRNRSNTKALPHSDQLYQNYLEKYEEEGKKDKSKDNDPVISDDATANGICESNEDSYCSYIDKAIFGSVTSRMNNDNVIVKRNNKGLVAKLVTYDDEKRLSDEIIKHNLQKVHFFEQSPECKTLDDIFDGCDCRDDVTYARGTVTVSSTGACEV